MDHKMKIERGGVVVQICLLGTFSENLVSEYFVAGWDAAQEMESN